MVGVRPWCFTTWVLFMLYPKDFISTASARDEWFYYNKIQKSGFVKSMPPKPILNNGIRKVSTSTLEEAEPGFDFNEEEMKKLKIWPGGVIPYYIDEFSFDKVFRDRIRSFLDTTNSATGLNFLELHLPPGDEETRWVLFINRQGLLNCVDHPFKNFTNDGVQKVLLGYDCVSNVGQLAEIVLALVGVPPQHNAPNRANYIEVIKENIIPRKYYLFKTLQDNEWLFHEVDYDFASAGHYNLHKYTVNGKATIQPLEYIKEIIFGEKEGFSYTDIWKIRMIYNYISKKRRKSVKVPECNKLFNLDTNFSSYVHESEDDVQPRKKPNKYLGLPDDPTETPNTDYASNNDTNTNPIKADKDVSEEENAENTNIDEQNSENEAHKSSNSNKISNPKDVSENKDKPENSVKEELENKNIKHSFEQQSEDKADDEKVDEKLQDLKFTRPGKG